MPPLAALLLFFPAGGLEQLPVLEDSAAPRFHGDWLVDAPKIPCTAYRSPDGREIVLTNGIARRVFTLVPHPAGAAFHGIATTAIDELVTGESFVRAVEPEAVLTLGGTQIRVGGLEGQADRAFLRVEDIEKLRVPADALVLVDVATGPIPARMEWKRVRWSEDRPWPPRGLRLTLVFEPAPGSKLPHCRVEVQHDVYEGLPLFGKTVVVARDAQEAPLVLDALESERLAVVEPQSSVELPEGWLASNLVAESEMGMFGQSRYTGAGAVRWELEPEFETQVNYALKTPCRLVCGPPLGPGVTLGTLRSPTVFELLHDSHDRERRGLEKRRMYRTIAPWCTENPILMHARDASPAAVKLAIDQCSEVGFEMLILSFGSGVDMESEDPAYLKQMRELADYAHSKKVELGGYSLLASRSISPTDDVIDPKTGMPGNAIFGSSPCLGSKWGQDYFKRLENFITTTGMDVLEHDGSYPGDVCASTTHPGHKSLADSQWTQWRTICDFYARCRARGVYLNVPDWYFLAGSTKSAMGYRETNWSLPRDQQVLHGRQNLFDGTWEKTPSMGWMFVPLTEYQGGGAAATIEPLKEHLDAYEAHLANNFGAGAQACYRGPRLYDSEETKALVAKWVGFYKRHRRILDADLVHLRRADGRDWDGWLHVDPSDDERALAMLYNPLATSIRRTLTIPLHYAGLEGRVSVAQEEGAARTVTLDAEQKAEIEVEIPARGRTWLVFRAP
jgi:hypothetical protein